MRVNKLLMRLAPHEVKFLIDRALKFCKGSYIINLGNQTLNQLDRASARKKVGSDHTN